jgi:myo-inositol-1(or 4)-monophosphatase
MVNVYNPRLSLQFCNTHRLAEFVPESYNNVVSDNTEISTEWIEACDAAARAGGRELVAWRGRFSAREKAPADLVTDADLASQEAIRRVIAERFPDHAFLGEESSGSFRHGDGQMVWIVDPLDGTTNYVHGYSQYAVSVALAHGSEPLVGVVYDPMSDECFSAARGHGTWCNGVRLAASSVVSLSESLVAVGLPARVRRDSPDLLNFIEAVQVCQAVRRTGSAALNLAYIARGCFDAFWSTQIHPWDVAAGVLLVREAGGIVTGRDGSDFDLWNPRFLSAGTPALHNALLDVLTPHE